MSNKELNKEDKSCLLNNFPNIKLSYETPIHKKVYNSDYILAIPDGTPCFIWFTSFKNKLANPKFHKLFESITVVENMDFQDLLLKYDSPTTYFYMDPPYWKTENYYSNHDFDVNDHLRLADTLKSLKGKWSLSYYDFPLLSEWFPKDEYVWEKKLFAKAAAAKKGKTQNMGEELLIMNYSK